MSLKTRGVRELHPHVVWTYFTKPDGRMIGKNLHTGFSVFLNNGGVFELSANPRMEELTSPLRLATTAPAIPVGDYAWTEWKLLAQTDASRKIAVSGNYWWGGLWSGTQKTLQATVTLQPSGRAKLAVGINRTDGTLTRPAADFVTSLYTLRGNYSFSTNMYLDALMQVNRDTHQVNTNIRFNLMHHPLSDLFIVYNEQRFTTPDALRAGRGLIVKFSQMVSF